MKNSAPFTCSSSAAFGSGRVSSQSGSPVTFATSCVSETGRISRGDFRCREHPRLDREFIHRTREELAHLVPVPDASERDGASVVAMGFFSFTSPTPSRSKTARVARIDGQGDEIAKHRPSAAPRR